MFPSVFSSILLLLSHFLKFPLGSFVISPCVEIQWMFNSCLIFIPNDKGNYISKKMLNSNKMSH